MTAVQQQMVEALAAIDEALGMPPDGCNSTAMTLWAIGELKARPIPRRGLGVAITRKDGSTFLASAHPGLMPAVWTPSQRRFAVAHKRELIGHGFKARVVPVT